MVSRDIRGQNTGLERPRRFFGAQMGSFQSSSVFCPRPNSSSRTAQPLALHNLRVTVELTRGVPDTVNRVFHAPVTVANISGRTERSPRTK
jgi:hypothetical protein